MLTYNFKKVIVNTYHVKEGYRNKAYFEFERIFSDLFSSRSDTYKTIVERLADGHCELKDIYTDLKVEKNSLVSEYMEDLVTAGLFHVNDVDESVLESGFFSSIIDFNDLRHKH